MTPSTDLKKPYEDVYDEILKQESVVQLEKSGLTLNNIAYTFVNMDEYEITKDIGSHFPLPKWLKDKKAIINPLTKDDYCLKTCNNYCPK